MAYRILLNYEIDKNKKSQEFIIAADSKDTALAKFIEHKDVTSIFGGYPAICTWKPDDVYGFFKQDDTHFGVAFCDNEELGLVDVYGNLKRGGNLIISKHKDNTVLIG